MKKLHRFNYYDLIYIDKIGHLVNVNNIVRYFEREPNNISFRASAYSRIIKYFNVPGVGEVKLRYGTYFSKKPNGQTKLKEKFLKVLMKKGYDGEYDLHVTLSTYYKLSKQMGFNIKPEIYILEDINKLVYVSPDHDIGEYILEFFKENYKELVPKYQEQVSEIIKVCEQDYNYIPKKVAKK